MPLAKEKIEYAFLWKSLANLNFYQNIFNSFLEISLDQTFLFYWWKPEHEV